MTRVLAAIGAVALIAAAVVVREQVIEGEDGTAGRRSVDTSILCAREVPDGACDAEEDLATTLGRLLDDDRANDPQAWLTVGRFPETVRGFDETKVLAETDLVAVALQIPAECSAGLTWRCLGDAAIARGRISGPLRSSSVRVIARAAMLGGFIGRTDYAINDLDEVPGARDWIVNVDQAIDRARDRQAATLGDFLAARGAAADVFITTAAEAQAAGVRSDLVSSVAPPVRVAAVLGVRERVDADSARKALVAGGWREVAPGQHGDDGLPSPGVLVALREI